MAAPTEVLITTDISGQLWNACVWDTHSGTSLLTYKGNSTGPRSLCLLGRDYLLGAVSNKPLLQVWPLQRKEQIQTKMVCPGKVSALCVTSDGGYCIAAIAEKIHVWQVATGNLLSVLTRHYQRVTCLRCSDDNSCFISGGDDSLVIVWSLSSVLCRTSEPSVRQSPMYVWTSHSLPITDICIGMGGQRARVVSSSLDQTCRLWDLSSGALLLTIMFDNGITSVTMDTPEYRLFAGSGTGTIYAVNLFSQPVRTERHVSSTETEENVTYFRGHSKQVTCLSVSFDGSLLTSGSHDAKVKVWDVTSGQCVRTIDHKGAVTNILSLLAPHSMFSHDHKPTLPLQQFKRHLYTEEESRADNCDRGLGLETVDVRVSNLIQADDRLPTLGEDWRGLLREEKMDTGEEVNLEGKLTRLEQKLQEVQNVNKELYHFTLNHLQNKSPLT